MNMPKRKPNRLKGYDYSYPGRYFITICIKNKECLLGSIAEFDGREVPQMILSPYGKIVEEKIAIMNEKHSHIKIDKYVIMPNHLHLILNIFEYVPTESGASETAAPYNNQTSQFVSLLKRYCNREFGKNVWQTSYHDHIIRGEKDYLKIWEYIDTIVLRWQYDCFYK